MWNEKNIKKIYQYQFGTINSSVNLNKNKEVFEFVNYVESNNQNYEDHFLKMKIEDMSPQIHMILRDIKENILDRNQLTNVHFLTNGDFYGIEKGSYNLKFPFFIKTDYFSKDFKIIFDKKIKSMFLIYSDIEWIKLYGKQGLNFSLRQSGEIRYLIRNFFKNENFEVDSLDLNPNLLAHAAGLNINKMLIVDVIVIWEKTDVV